MLYGEEWFYPGTPELLNTFFNTVHPTMLSDASLWEMATEGSTEGEGSGLCLDDCGLDLDSMIYLIDLNTRRNII